ncbi:hypothetical protein [Microvirga rosea]|uniref:hypothetical protein n=1 Tax=Microvirga rosea TaxID=2715425 RepID=UPI001D0A9135|nr:hypothetical protein [Microvirga rosea]MCB8821268.1 hypothetical protein [Microvirga rosea]
MILPDILAPDILFSRDVKHSMLSGRFCVEAQNTSYEGELIFLSFYSGLSQRIGFTPKQGLQLISAISEANRYCQGQGSTARPSWKSLSIGRKSIYLAQIIAYYIFPNVIFKKEIPSSFENGRVFIQVEENFFGKIHLVFALITGVSGIPKIHFPPAAISSFVEALEEALRRCERKNGRQ